MAYVNFISVDRNFVPQTDISLTNFVRIIEAAKESGANGGNGLHERLYAEVTVKQAGYMYIYLSNESPTTVEVYFDDFKVTQVKSPVIQTDDYYPFGLTFNSYQRENSTPNQYLYNGKEKQDELELGWFDYGARMYNPEISRWMVVDPAADAYYRSSPYSYTLNNPVRFVDPDGSIVQDPPDVITTISNVNTSNRDITTREASIIITLKVVNSNGADLSNTMFKGDKGSVELKNYEGYALQLKDADSGAPHVETNVKSFTVQFEVVESLDQVGKDDHVMMLVVDIPEGDFDGDGAKENPVGLADKGGRVSAVETGTLKDGSFNEVAQHELGHKFGLDHTKGGSGLMGKSVNGQTSLSSTEKGKAVAGSHVGPFDKNGTYKASSLYGRTASKKLAEDFTKKYKITE